MLPKPYTSASPLMPGQVIPCPALSITHRRLAHRPSPALTYLPQRRSLLKRAAPAPPQDHDGNSDGHDHSGDDAHDQPCRG